MTVPAGDNLSPANASFEESPISDISELSVQASIMTEEEGTMSGELDVTVDDSGKGMVRYRGTESWNTIGNIDAEPPRTWEKLTDLVAAIEANVGERDAAGNTLPFEA
ncbi:hypothetical protein [Nocardia callitridis]|uniref:Uncharacterized protein n=1 Tax=Nocardia callitridis TaxID=648753 RepID=A0ABP9KVP5_9NOCA